MTTTPAIEAWTRKTHAAREVYRALPTTAGITARPLIAHCCCQTCRRKP